MDMAMQCSQPIRHQFVMVGHGPKLGKQMRGLLRADVIKNMGDQSRQPILCGKAGLFHRSVDLGFARNKNLVEQDLDQQLLARKVMIDVSDFQAAFGGDALERKGAGAFLDQYMQRRLKDGVHRFGSARIDARFPALGSNTVIVHGPLISLAGRRSTDETEMG